MCFVETVCSRKIEFSQLDIDGIADVLVEHASSLKSLATNCLYRDSDADAHPIKTLFEGCYNLETLLLEDPQYPDNRVDVNWKVYRTVTPASFTDVMQPA